MVNVKDFEVSDFDFEIPSGMLGAIFYRQGELLEKYREIEGKTLPHVVPEKLPVDINSYAGQDQIKERFYWAISEICEALDCLKNKPWKQSMVEVDVDHFREEVVDALHFFVEGCILAGIPAEVLYHYYMRKSEVNKFRQRSKY